MGTDRKFSLRCSLLTLTERTLSTAQEALQIITCTSLGLTPISLKSRIIMILLSTGTLSLPKLKVFEVFWALKKNYSPTIWEETSKAATPDSVLRCWKCSQAGWSKYSMRDEAPRWKSNGAEVFSDAVSGRTHNGMGTKIFLSILSK